MAGMLDSAVAYDQHRATIFYPKTDLPEHVHIYPALNAARDQDLLHNLDIVRDICSRIWQTPPIQILPIATAGTFHLLYKIEFSQACYVIRLNRRPEHHRAWEFLLDGWIYPKLASLNLPCPSTIAIDCARMHSPTDYQIMTYVPGMMLNVFQDAQTQHMSPTLLQAIGRYVAQVHTISLAGFGPFSVASLNQPSPSGIHASWHDYIFLRLDQHIDLCLAIKAITTIEAVTIKTLFHDHSKIFECGSPVLLHGDLGNHNFLSADGLSITALIDWEDCMSGDPVFDIAYWGTFFRDHMRHDFLAGYASIAKLPDDFELRYWLYFLRIALSKTVHRFRFGYSDALGRPPASLRIQRGIEYARKFLHG